MASSQPSGERRVSALLLSLLVCPGAGQFLLGRRRRGALMALLAVGLTFGLLAFLTWHVFVELAQGTPEDDPLAVLHAMGLAIAHHQAVLVAGLLALTALWLWSAADTLLGGRAPKGP